MQKPDQVERFASVLNTQRAPACIAFEGRVGVGGTGFRVEERQNRGRIETPRLDDPPGKLQAWRIGRGPARLRMQSATGRAL